MGLYRPSRVDDSGSLRGHVQNEYSKEFGGSGPQVAGAWNRRSQGRGREHNADHNRRSSKRASVHDLREGQRHDQGGLERFRFVKRVGNGRK